MSEIQRQLHKCDKGWKREKFIMRRRDLSFRSRCTHAHAHTFSFLSHARAESSDAWGGDVVGSFDWINNGRFQSRFSRRREGHGSQKVRKSECLLFTRVMNDFTSFLANSPEEISRDLVLRKHNRLRLWNVTLCHANPVPGYAPETPYV